VVVGGFDKKVTMYNVCAGTEMSHFTCADDSVWSVHLSADSSLLAIGSGQTTNTAKGYVCLYDANAHGPGPTGGTSPGLLARWDHPRVVWCVRLSPDGTVLVAADWNMKMTVYDTHPSQLRQIQQLDLFTSMSFSCLGRSMQFSPDNSHLALGCWSGNAHLYRLSRAASGARTVAAGAPAPPSCTPSLSGNFVLGTP
jgi:WD40 repeat protein